MASQTPPRDTPFGLEANVAAGLAYLFGLIGGIVMLAGGGTNKFVRWAAAQSIVLWGAYIVLEIMLSFVSRPLYLTGGFYAAELLYWAVGVLWLVAWIWTFISAFQGKEVRVPVVAGLTESIFKNML